jgi:hypothetical protein
MVKCILEHDEPSEAVPEHEKRQVPFPFPDPGEERVQIAPVLVPTSDVGALARRPAVSPHVISIYRYPSSRKVAPQIGIESAVIAEAMEIDDSKQTLISCWGCPLQLLQLKRQVCLGEDLRFAQAQPHLALKSPVFGGPFLEGRNRDVSRMRSYRIEGRGARTLIPWEGLGKVWPEKTQKVENQWCWRTEKGLSSKQLGKDTKARKEPGRTAKPPFVGSIPTGASRRDSQRLSLQ